jgi:hypothetical protein
MSTAHRDGLVGEYLRRLEDAAAHLPRSRQVELVTEIREHIDDALAEAGASDEVAVRNVLERLGPPEEIAAAAGPPPPHRTGGRLELAATILIAIPFVGWVLGPGLVVFSRAWTSREKLIGVALCLVPVVVLALGFTALSADSGPTIQIGAGTPFEPLPHESGDGGAGPLELVVILGSLLAGPLAAVYLGTRLRGRPEETSVESA